MSGGGGGSPPAWARSGSVADIDFVNNPPRAWTATGGEVAFAAFNTILGESPSFPGFSYDPGKVDLGVGYGGGVGDQGTAALIGALANVFMFDFTVVFEFDANFVFNAVDVTFATDISYRCASNSVPGLRDDIGGNNLLDPSGLNGDAGAHKGAITITAPLAYTATDNVSGTLSSEVGADTTIDPDTPQTPTELIINASLLKRMTVYSPIKTEAEQRALTV